LRGLMHKWAPIAQCVEETFRQLSIEAIGFGQKAATRGRCLVEGEIRDQVWRCR